METDKPITFTNVTVDMSICSGGGPGGAFFVSTGDNPVTLENSSITNCEGGTGGGFYFSSGDRPLTIKNSTIDSNLASSSVGGGAFISNGDSVSITDSSFDNNFANTSGGGGAYISNSDHVTLARSSFNGNFSTSGAGGGAFISHGGNFTCIDTSFNQNILHSGTGGGLYSSHGGDSTIDGCLFYDNHATGAGNIAGGAYLSFGGMGLVQNSTFSGNSSAAVGGGLYFSSPTMSFNNITVANNSLSDPGAMGSGLFNSAGSTEISNSILSNNNGVAMNCGGAAFTSLGNNIDDDASCALAGAGDKNVDPLLDPIADNGGLTMTHAIKIGSPAMDAGNNATCLAVDQRDAVRPFDGDQNGSSICDIGAFESQDACPNDPNKLLPGQCGCGVPDTDAGGNGILDCFVNQELSFRADTLRNSVASIKKKKNKKNNKRKKQAKKDLAEVSAYADANVNGIAVAASAGKTLPELKSDVEKKTKKAIRFQRKKPENFKKAKKRALKAIDALNAAV